MSELSLLCADRICSAGKITEHFSITEKPKPSKHGIIFESPFRKLSTVCKINLTAKLKNQSGLFIEGVPVAGNMRPFQPNCSYIALDIQLCNDNYRDEIGEFAKTATEHIGANVNITE